MPDKSFFFISRSDILNQKFILDKSESHHFKNVLRKSIGSEIWLTDGEGTVYRSVVDVIEKNSIKGTIIEEYPNFGENSTNVSLGIGILKRVKMDLVVEKATECGVNKIIPLIMDRSIKRTVNIDRLTKIALSATKQCGRSITPLINDPIKLENYLKGNTKSIFVFHESGKYLNSNTVPDNNIDNILAVIGPEGDFSDVELELLKSHKAFIYNLGKRRLRSETAVVTALSQLNLIFN